MILRGVSGECRSIQHSFLLERHLTQTEAAELLGIDQPKVSALMRGKLTGFSTERCFRFLNALGCDVEIVVKRKSKSGASGKTKVIA
ncbi:helix-turn-helix transcriptional regulator [Microcoleus sp. FACHB-68]|uniref:helix-turn-helix domain-containing protein n=1 Tax=Microcoleus sp. FACHB-68 TaxID=2692826 RepID=UPI0018EFD09D|nr:helix-turn-helix transcriptional regulator [Microcoleus sp. FACHB-68]